MTISNYLEENIINHMLRNAAFTPVATIYTSLHTADPGETGASEVTGGSYARQTVTLSAASGGGATSSTNQLDFTNMPAVTVTHVGIWDALTAGNFYWGGALTTSKTLNGGDTFRIATGDLDITLD